MSCHLERSEKPALYSLGQLHRSFASLRMTGSIYVLAACLLLSATSGWAQEKKSSPDLIVAAAADLSTALKEIGDNLREEDWSRK